MGNWLSGDLAEAWLEFWGVELFFGEGKLGSRSRDWWVSKLPASERLIGVFELWLREFFGDWRYCEIFWGAGILWRLWRLWTLDRKLWCGGGLSKFWFERFSKFSSWKMLCVAFGVRIVWIERRSLPDLLSVFGF